MKSKFYFFTAILIFAAVFSGCNKETYTVTFNPNGGTGTMQPQTFTEGESQALNRNTFTYDGYTFTGWNTVQDGSGISYPDGQTITATMDMTLYAQWTSNGTSGGGQQGGENPTPTPPNPAGSPTVETGSTEITGASVIFSGNVTAAGDAPVTARGFMYGTSADNFSNSVECGTGTGSFTSDPISGLYGVIYYKAYATNSVGTAYGEVKQFTLALGTLNDHIWADLGLPSGIKWATCNVGASTPTGRGNYFAWGETTTKSSYTSDNYTYSDNPTTLPSNRDAATVNWGSGWRMPTYGELSELKNNCTVTWTTQNGVNGCLFTGPNGNSIFLPAAGFRFDSSLFDGSGGNYWSSSFGSSDTYSARNLFFYSDHYGMNYRPRYYGLSVRAVCQP